MTHVSRCISLCYCIYFLSVRVCVSCSLLFFLDFALMGYIPELKVIDR